MKNKSVVVYICAFALGLVSMIVVLAGPVQAEDGPSLFVEFPVPGQPLDVAVEGPGKVWFTLPAQNAVGRLWVTSTTEYQVVTYTIPTANSEPSYLVYTDGIIWFTESAGNKIGRLEPGTGNIAEFSVPTSGSYPTGIDARNSGSQTHVWFTERDGNKLARLVFTSTENYTVTEYSLPSQFSNGQPQDLYIQNLDSIWFTAPGVNRIGNLKPSRWPSSNAFVLVYTGGGSRPWSIKVDSDGFPWFTDVISNRIGQFFPQTTANFKWYTLPFPNSAPYDLAISSGAIWFTERDGNRVGQLNPNTGAIREFGLPAGSAPKGLAVDSSGCVWIAENGRGRIGRWCPPYFRFVYLPLVLRNFGQ